MNNIINLRGILQKGYITVGSTRVPNVSRGIPPSSELLISLLM